MFDFVQKRDVSVSVKSRVSSQIYETWSSPNSVQLTSHDFLLLRYLAILNPRVAANVNLLWASVEPAYMAGGLHYIAEGIEGDGNSVAGQNTIASSWVLPHQLTRIPCAWLLWPVTSAGNSEKKLRGLLSPLKKVYKSLTLSRVTLHEFSHCCLRTFLLL